MRLGRPGRRLSIGFGAVCTLLLVVTGRLVQLQGVGIGNYASQATAEHVRTEILHAARGSIVDRNGIVLAYTADAKDIVADPSLINCTYPDAKADLCQPQDHLPLALKLAAITGTGTDKIINALAVKGQYASIAQAIPPAQAAQVEALNLRGIYSEPTTQRLYPGGTTAANIVGMVQSDGTGAAGIEREFNTLLQGKNGTYTYNQTATGGMNPAGTTRRTPAVDGGTVHLTISQDLQFVVQRDLDAAVLKLRAKSGNVAVLDTRTGQVLALAGSETQNFNPQDPSTYPKQNVDSAIQLAYEPGSVNKVVTFTAALQTKIITPRSVLTVPDHLAMGGVTVHDDWYHQPLKLTATGIIAKSSNIGTLEIARKVGPTTFVDYLKAYGVGDKTGIELPAESAGTLLPRSQWSASTFANLPIGQGLAVTPAPAGLDLSDHRQQRRSRPAADRVRGHQPGRLGLGHQAARRDPRDQPGDGHDHANDARIGAAQRRYRLRLGPAGLPDRGQDRYRATDRPEDPPLQQQRVLGLLRRHRSGRQSAVRGRSHDQRAGRWPVRRADRGPVVPRHRHL